MKKRKSLFSIVLAFIMLLFTLFPTYQAISTMADTTLYSDVLDDLEEDSNFNISSYPSKAGDYTLQLIQIAESTTGELLVYVYQPSNGTLEENLKASYINLAVDEDGLDYQRYTLEHLDSTSTMSKYKVVDFTVSTATYRYYTISTIYRPWISGVDPNPSVGTTIDNIEYGVGRTWRVYYYNNVLTYECKYIDTVDIVNKFCDSIRYPEGFQFFPTSCDSHYVAFSTNRNIERLIDVDVIYDLQEYYSVFGPYGTSQSGPSGDPLLNQKRTLTELEKVTLNPSGWFAPTYNSFKRIETANAFLNSEDFTLNEEVLNEFNTNQYQWVLRFLETDHTYSVVSGETVWYQVESLSILRLHFVEDGRVYNLGVVDNMMSADGKPGNDTAETLKIGLERTFEKFWDMLLQLVGVILIILLIWQFAPHIIIDLIKLVFKTIWKGIKTGLSWIFRFITAPFRWLFG